MSSGEQDNYKIGFGTVLSKSQLPEIRAKCRSLKPQVLLTLFSFPGDGRRRWEGRGGKGRGGKGRGETYILASGGLAGVGDSSCVGLLFASDFPQVGLKLRLLFVTLMRVCVFKYAYVYLYLFACLYVVCILV